MGEVGSGYGVHGLLGAELTGVEEFCQGAGAEDSRHRDVLEEAIELNLFFQPVEIEREDDNLLVSFKESLFHKGTELSKEAKQT